MDKVTFLSALNDHDTMQIVGPMAFDKRNHNTQVPTIYVDGGIRHSLPTDLLSLSIGDNDSNTSEREIDIKLKQNKDISDLDAALALIPEYIKKTNLRGFSGGRMDHQIINLGSIHHFLKNRSDNHICLIDEKIKVFKSGRNSFSHHGTFSLITLEKQRVRVYGDCHYVMKELTSIDVLTSLTLSNIGNGEVHIECELPLFIYLD